MVCDRALSHAAFNRQLNQRQEPTREPPPPARARAKPSADLPDYVPPVVVAVLSRQSVKARKAFRQRLAEAPDEQTAADALAELAQSLENGAEPTNLAAYFARILARHAETVNWVRAYREKYGTEPRSSLHAQMRLQVAEIAAKREATRQAEAAGRTRPGRQGEQDADDGGLLPVYEQLIAQGQAEDAGRAKRRKQGGSRGDTH